MREFIINKNDSGQRTDRFILKAVPLLPKSLLYKYIRLKRIKLNGKRCEISQTLSENDVLSLYINDEFFEANENKKYYNFDDITQTPDIVYEDENILIAFKPVGMDVHRGSENTKETLIDIVKAYLFHKGEYSPETESSFAPALCNRLDRNTTGLVIAAKNAAALREINEKIRNREISKRYLCICCGKLQPESAVKTAYLKKGQHNLVDISADSKEDYKKIVTEYKTLDFKNNFTLAEINLITGRTHQIRAHLAFLGHPVLGDGKYGNIAINKRTGIFHQQLCAYSLEFNFSTSGCLDYLNGKLFKAKNCGFSTDIFKQDFFKL